jgi:GntR family transcriptional regulator
VSFQGVIHHPERINRNSKVPLYEQLYEMLRSMIRRREWQPGDMIPPEPELCEEYGVSRTTVRQVLDKLVNEGLIYRERGRGTFVARPTVEKAMVRIVSFTEDMRRRGIKPGTEVLSSDLAPAPEDIAGRLEIAPGEELVRLERLRLADGEPMAIEESYLVHRYCPGVLTGDYAVVPLREALERNYGIRLVRARQVIRAVLATKRLAELLSVKQRAPLLYIERVSYSQHEVPVEFLRIYYRADRYSLYNELQG